MDGELAESDAVEIERHVEACTECRDCISAYEDVSRGFAAYYAATTQTAIASKPTHHVPRWVPVLAAAAAMVVLVLALLPRSAKPVPTVPQIAVATPPVAVQIAAASLKPVATHHVAAHKKAPRANWAMAEPAIQIAIPADSMFPPGAVPEGVTYIANLSLAADGSVQGIRLQP